MIRTRQRRLEIDHRLRHKSYAVIDWSNLQEGLDLDLEEEDPEEADQDAAGRAFEAGAPTWVSGAPAPLRDQDSLDLTGEEWADVLCEGAPY